MTAESTDTTNTVRPESEAQTPDQRGEVERPEQPRAGADTTAAQHTTSAGAEARELERQLDDVRRQLREAEERARENLDRWQRAQADLANFRRRAQFEREALEKYAVASLVALLLPVLDSFERAWNTLPVPLRRLTWLSGVAMIHSQLRGTLERVGLTEIEAEGQAFDSHVHEALDREAGEGPPHVVAVLQAGYRLHERVLRPALVKVGPKPPSAEARGQESRVKGQGEAPETASPRPGPESETQTPQHDQTSNSATASG
ncbi:MAG: nucleotide exchange factor GrpE [Chloroflexi bacterium]|nr:nucleotide exchange factor GrpE [Chloroflexota bacterium]